MAVHNDFSIEISATPIGYTVRARASAGQAQAETSLPLSSLELENRLQAVELSLLRGRGGLRRALSDNERQAQELGQILFDFLLSGPVRALFDLSRLESERGERGLRLLLTVQPPELAALPWELLYHSREGEFLALSQSTPVVRYWAAPYAQQALTVTPPLRVLGVVAGPADWEALDVAQEKQRLEEALAPLQQSRLAELVWLDGQSRRDLQSAMRSGPWHVVHFIGHGGFDKERDEGFIVLCDEAGQAAPLYAVELARLVADHPSLWLVFLNACEGATGSQSDDLASSAAALIRRSVPAVVAMQYPISDSGAIEFARTFYEALADNLPIDAAVTDARKAVSLAAPHSPEWATPVLFLSSQDGRLFSLEKAVAVVPPPEISISLDDPPHAPSRWSGLNRYFWQISLLIILVLAAWQVWPQLPNQVKPEITKYPADLSQFSGTSTPDLPMPQPVISKIPTSKNPSVVFHIQSFEATRLLEPVFGLERVSDVSMNELGPGRIEIEYRRGTDRGLLVIPITMGNHRIIDLNRGEIELWYRPDYDHNPKDNINRAIAVVGGWDAPTQLRLAVSGHLTFSIFEDSHNVISVKSSPNRSLWEAGEWVHIRVSWDSAKMNDPVQIYVNHERVDTYRSLRPWLITNDAYPEMLYVGGGNDKGIMSPDGVIDDVIIRPAPSDPPVVTVTPLPTPTPISGWARLGESGPEIDGWVYALAVSDDTVYIGGSFKNPSPGILTWNRRTGNWDTLGGGVTGTVQSLLVDGTDVYMGGDFSVEGQDGEPIRGLARWDGEGWNGFGSGLSGITQGPVSGVAALALDSEKNLYVGGIFTGAGNGDNTGITARGILRWNRALARWQRLGGDDYASGLVRFSTHGGPVFVAALEVVGDYLYVGGHFAAIQDRNGGIFPYSRNFARWHIPSEQWEGVGSVDSNSGYGFWSIAVYTIAADGDDIYIGGDFNTVYDPDEYNSIDAVHLARWNHRSREWGGICCINVKDDGLALFPSTIVRALFPSEKGLYVAGRFNEAGDQAANNVARYRNGSWARLTMSSPTLGTVAGVNDTIFTLSLAGDEVIVGGKFTGFGEVTNGSGLARWGE